MNTYMLYLFCLVIYLTFISLYVYHYVNDFQVTGDLGHLTGLSLVAHRAPASIKKKMPTSYDAQGQNQV